MSVEPTVLEQCIQFDENDVPTFTFYGQTIFSQAKSGQNTKLRAACVAEVQKLSKELTASWTVDKKAAQEENAAAPCTSAKTPAKKRPAASGEKAGAAKQSKNLQTTAKK